MRATALRIMGLGVALALTGCDGGPHSAGLDELASTRTALKSNALTLGADTSIDGSVREEYCKVPQDVLAQLGSGVKRQLRVRMGSGATFQEGLCTVIAALDAGTGAVVMHPEGIARLDMTADAGVVLTAMHGADADRAGVTWHAPTDTGAVLDSMESTKPNDLVERLTDDGLNNTLIYTAPHGGHIEPKTAEQVERIAPSATSRVSSWRVKGWYAGNLNSKDHWHITSADISEASYPSLGEVMGRDFKYAVSFHGYADTSYPDAGVLVGGREDVEFRKGVAESLTDALRGTGLAVEHQPSKLAGAELGNFVNRLALDRRGLQLEQSNTARTSYWERIADAVKAHYTCLVDTTAEDALTLAGAAVSGASNGTGYDSTGCKLYAADLTVNPRSVATTYSVTASTPLAGLSAADCGATEWYVSVYRWGLASGRYHRVGGSRGVGSYTGGTCQPDYKSGYSAVSIPAPLTGALPGAYRVVAWARRYPSPTSETYTALPVSVRAGP
jgi:phage replication-related protein YjqB (UPF0714/DUF867 family)